MKSDTQPLVINGREVECPMCSHNRFWTRKTLMNTVSESLFGFNWAGKAADNYICDTCGYVIWFLRR